MPKVSAVMALYNTPFKYLDKTIESILNQTFADFELIIVDDCSEIEYKDYFDKLNDKRIIYKKLEKNSGPGNARNVGIKMTSGEYVAICDSDDINHLKRFEIQNQFLDEHPDIDILGAGIICSNRKKANICIEKDADIKAFMLLNSPIANPSIMYRKASLAKNELLYATDNNFAEDYSLFIDAANSNLKFHCISDILVTYTRRGNQLSKIKQSEQIKQLKTLYEKVLKYYDIEYSPDFIEIQYKINTEDFNNLTDSEITEWFEKIIQSQKFDITAINKLKAAILYNFNEFKNRILKIKLGNKDLCMDNKLKIYINNRT